MKSTNHSRICGALTLALANCFLVCEASEPEEKSERYLELGLATADAPNLVNLSFVHRIDHVYGYTSFGAPSLVNIGAGIAANKDGTGLNGRLGLSLDWYWNASLSYSWKYSERNYFEAGVGYGRAIEGGWFTGDIIYPVLSFRRVW